MLAAAGAAVAMIILAVAVALAITGRLSNSGAGPVASIATTLRPTAQQSAVTDDVGSLLCTAGLDLAAAQTEHASPLATLLGDNLANGGQLSAADIATIRAHVQAIGETVARHIQAIAQLHSPTFADLILQEQKAYAGYGQWALSLKSSADAQANSAFDYDLTNLVAGHDALTSALNELATLNAAGTVSCQVPIF